MYINVIITAVVTLLETHKETGEECVRTVAFLRKGNSFGVCTQLTFKWGIKHLIFKTLGSTCLKLT